MALIALHVIESWKLTRIYSRHLKEQRNGRLQQFIPPARGDPRIFHCSHVSRDIGMMIARGSCNKADAVTLREAFLFQVKAEL